MNGHEHCSFLNSTYWLSISPRHLLTIILSTDICLTRAALGHQPLLHDDIHQKQWKKFAHLMKHGSSLKSMSDYLRGDNRGSLMILFSFSFIFTSIITSKLLNVCGKFCLKFLGSKIQFG